MMNIFAKPIPGVEKFENEYVYFSFYSVSGCTIYLEAKFTEPVVRKIDSKKSKGKNADDMDDMEFLVMRNYVKFKEKYDKNNGRDFTEENKDLANYNAQRLLWMREQL